MLETKISDLTVNEFRVLVREVVRQTLDEIRDTGELPLDDPRFPLITYRRGGSGISRPVIRGTAIHVQTVAVAVNQLKDTPELFAENYNLDLKKVNEALNFYQAHREEIDANIESEKALERKYKKNKKARVKKK